MAIITYKIVFLLLLTSSNIVLVFFLLLFLSLLLQFVTLQLITLCSSVGLMMGIDPPDGAIKQPNHTVGDGGQEMSLVFF